jgi:hypothetical protein
MWSVPAECFCHWQVPFLFEIQLIDKSVWYGYHPAIEYQSFSSGVRIVGGEHQRFLA